MTFEELGLIRPLLRAIADAGYRVPTPIQRDAIGPALARRDIVGCAQTGTGKTASFALPILQHIDDCAGDQPRIRALILSPTRELAAQIGASFSTYGRHLDLYHTVIFGGVSERPQIAQLERGVDILVATPGRLLDLHGRGFVDLRHVEILVLDEADHMLDMGFLPDVRRIIKALPPKRQNLLFSATMPAEIRALADGVLVDPVSIAVTPAATPADNVQQKVYFVDKSNKRKLLADVLGGGADARTLVFSRTKHGANRVVKFLSSAGVKAAAIHGNKSQNARTQALGQFKSGKLDVLVATDIAARGIDVSGVTHVINFDLPNVPETYIHRIGRTARAGADGVAVSFCDDEERAYLADIERLVGAHIDRVLDHDFPPASRPPAATNLEGKAATTKASPSRSRGRSKSPSKSKSKSSRPRRGGPGRGNRRSSHARPSAN